MNAEALISIAADGEGNVLIALRDRDAAIAAVRLKAGEIAGLVKAINAAALGSEEGHEFMLAKPLFDQGDEPASVQ